MISINLLPIRQIKQRIRARNELVSLVIGFLLLLTIIGFVAYGQTVKIDSLQHEQGRLQAEKRKYEAVLARIRKIQKQQKLVQVKIDAIRKLKANSQLSVRVLDEIAKLTPANRMWLKSLKMNQHTISLTGVALDNATIAQYMERIKKSPFFAGAELRNSSLVKVVDKKLKSFSLLLRLATF